MNTLKQLFSAVIFSALVTGLIAVVASNAVGFHNYRQAFVSMFVWSAIVTTITAFALDFEARSWTNSKKFTTWQAVAFLLAYLATCWGLDIFLSLPMLILFTAMGALAGAAASLGAKLAYEADEGEIK